MPLVQKLTLLKAKRYGLVTIKTDLIKPGNMVWSNLSIKILGINLGNFTLDNSIWDKTSANITRNINLWNRIRLSLRVRKLIINQIFLSKLWYIDQSMESQNILKKKLKKGSMNFYGKVRKSILVNIYSNSPFGAVG